MNTKDNPRLNWLEDTIPDLAIKSAQVNELGMNNIVIEVNNDLIFRFPRYEQGIEQLRRETNLLERLAGQLPLPIPQPKYINLTNVPEKSFCGYQKLPGEPLWGEDIPVCQDIRRRLAGQLGIFLSTLHSMPAEDFLSNSNSRGHFAHWQWFYAQVRDKLFHYMRPEARNQVSMHFEDYLTAKNFSFEDVLIHGDFGPTNILWDRERGSISGIIDFGSAGPGDPAGDIASLMGNRGYDMNFLHIIGDFYPGADRLLERAKFYIGTFALQDALHGLENGDEQAFADGMAQYI